MSLLLCCFDLNKRQSYYFFKKNIYPVYGYTFFLSKIILSENSGGVLSNDFRR